MDKFNLVSNFLPKGDQQEAIDKLVKGIKEDKKHQVLLGATGSGKTFTISNVINIINKPTLVLVHNKTLAGQLYGEFQSFFPNNRVEYFISNFDFYQPEAYLPGRDLYIDKSSVTNMDIEMLRSSAINSALERKDVIIVASVAAIYGLGNPEFYRELVFNLVVNEKLTRKEFLEKLVNAQYSRNDFDLQPGNFRVRGDVFEIMLLTSGDNLIRVNLNNDIIEKISTLDKSTWRVKDNFNKFPIFPAYAYSSTKQRILDATIKMEKELEERVEFYKNNNNFLAMERLTQRTRHDIESLKEFGMCKGIENYSALIEDRKKDETPYTLFDYLSDDFLLIVDESHVSLPQVRGMYNGDRSRKETLVEYGFRLPSALDNRPLRFNEFENKINQAIYVSATPGDWELEKSDYKIVEQIIRPTSLLDPIIEVVSKENQVVHILEQIEKTVKRNERVLITTLTIKMAETLTKYLKDRKIKVTYLHNETKTLERTQIIYELRKGTYDVLVGINLLREGLDLPEVSTILILDADKEGFLRSSKSLIQIIGRAARNINGKIFMYANNITNSMQVAIEETKRRRNIQNEYNIKNNITPTTIIKEIIKPQHLKEDLKSYYDKSIKHSKKQKDELIKQLEKEMLDMAKNLEFEKAAQLRDIILELKSE